MLRIAVLLTCYNRHQKTLNCLKSVYEQKNTEDTVFDVYLVDDHSPDDTGNIVKKYYPSVNVINGTGFLFWVGGMRLCWSEALKNNYDGYLLLNDDVLLKENAFEQLLKTHSYALTTYNKSGVYSGSTADPHTGKLSYGGRKLLSKWKEVSELVLPNSSHPLECDFAHANILLVMKEVVNETGILSEIFTHRLADYDYTLTARKKGFPILVCPNINGTCEDDHGKNWLAANSTLKQRIAYLKSPKYLAYSEYIHFTKKHFPFSLPETVLKLWLKTLFPAIWDKLKTKNH
jgi:GT2 family glycosyltransferase